MIRALTGRVTRQQLVLWEMLCEAARSTDLSLADAAPVAALLVAASDAARRPDGKFERLDAIVSDGRPTIVFTTFRDSLAWLRSRLVDHRPAWINGDGAGLGPATLDREAVLSWFRPEGRSDPHRVSRCPTILLTTDVAAEGLDLQGAGRIVHYDLPWTSVRIDQRNGRALRLGTRWDDIPIVEFHPPPDLETRLGQLERLARKRRLASRAGVAPDGHWLYRWRVDLAAWAGAVPPESRMSVVTGDEPGWLLGLALDLVDERGVTAPMPASLLWIGEDGSVTVAKQLVQLLCDVARRPWRAPSTADRRLALTVLLPIVRGRLRDAATALWRAPRRTPEHRVLDGGSAAWRKRRRSGEITAPWCGSTPFTGGSRGASPPARRS